MQVSLVALLTPPRAETPLTGSDNNSNRRTILPHRLFCGRSCPEWMTIPTPGRGPPGKGDPQQPLCVLKEQTIPIVLPGRRLRMPRLRGPRHPTPATDPARHPNYIGGNWQLQQAFSDFMRSPRDNETRGATSFLYPFRGIAFLPGVRRPESGGSGGPDRVPCSCRPPWTGSPTAALR